MFSRYIAGFAAVLAVLTLLPYNTLAIGQLTKAIEVDKIMRGQTFEELIRPFNSEDTQALFALSTSGDIEGWAEFFLPEDAARENPIITATVEPASYSSIVAVFTVPSDAANGVYEGQVVVSGLQGETEGDNRADVGQRVGREVIVTVTDEENVVLTATIIPVAFDVAKNAPLQMRVIYDSDSNIALRPDISLKVKRAGQIVTNVIMPFPEDEEPIRPRERRELQNLVEWQTAGQDISRYVAEIDILVNGEVVATDEFKFSVGFTTAAFLASLAELTGGSIVGAWAVVAVLVALIGFVITVAVRKFFGAKPAPQSVSSYKP